MSLSPEQRQAVTSWVAAGDNLATIQKKLSEQFKISMTYMDVRFLMDDLGLELKSSAPPKAAPDLASVRPAPEKKSGGLLDKLKKAVGAGEPEEAPEEETDAFPEEAAPVDNPAGLPEPPGGVKVDLDQVMRPGAMASGSVTFSDGMSGKWALDQYGRLMLDMGKKGYQPSAADIQVFQRELSIQLQRQGF